MIEHRQYERSEPITNITGYFELEKVVTGEFSNCENFVVKNISIGGYNLLTNYATTIGKNYNIFVNYGRQKYEFLVKIVHSSISHIQESPPNIFRPGVIYSVGCEVVVDRAVHKNLALTIIKNDCKSNQVKN